MSPDPAVSALCQQAVEGAREAHEAEGQPLSDPEARFGSCCRRHGLEPLGTPPGDCGSQGLGARALDLVGLAN